MASIICQIEVFPTGEPDGEINAERTYHVDMYADDVRNWYMRLTHWALMNNKGVLVEPYTGEISGITLYKPPPRSQNTTGDEAVLRRANLRRRAVG